MNVAEQAESRSCVRCGQPLDHDDAGVPIVAVTETAGWGMREDGPYETWFPFCWAGERVTWCTSCAREAMGPAQLAMIEGTLYTEIDDEIARLGVTWSQLEIALRLFARAPGEELRSDHNAHVLAWRVFQKDCELRGAICCRQFEFARFQARGFSLRESVALASVFTRSVERKRRERASIFVPTDRQKRRSKRWETPAIEIAVRELMQLIFAAQMAAGEAHPFSAARLAAKIIEARAPGQLFHKSTKETTWEYGARLVLARFDTLPADSSAC